MSGEHVPRSEIETRALLNARIEYWNNYLHDETSLVDTEHTSLAINELDEYWGELGLMGDEFMVSGEGEWAEIVYAEGESSLDEEGHLTLATPMSAHVITKAGTVDNMTGLSAGFMIRIFNDTSRPQIAYAFQLPSMVKDYNGLAVEKTSLYLLLKTEAVSLTNLSDFDERTYAAEIAPEAHLTQSEDDQSVRDARLASAAKISKKLDTESALFQTYVASSNFRWRRHDKQIAIIQHWLSEFDEEIPLFGHAVAVEATEIIANLADESEGIMVEDKYQLLKDKQFKISGVVGSIVMPGLDKLLRRPIRRDNDMVYFAGGLCLSIIPIEPIYIPKQNAYLPAHKPVMVPLSSQSYSVTLTAL